MNELKEAFINSDERSLQIPIKSKSYEYIRTGTGPMINYSLILNNKLSKVMKVLIHFQTC